MKVDMDLFLRKQHVDLEDDCLTDDDLILDLCQVIVGLAESRDAEIDEARRQPGWYLSPLGMDRRPWLQERYHRLRMTIRARQTKRRRP